MAVLLCMGARVRAADAVARGSSLVLGGVGAGSYVILGANGKFSYCGDHSEPLPGSFMAVRTDVEGRVETRLLQSGASMKSPVVSSLLYTREFPQAQFGVTDGRMGADISVLAFSPLIPHQLPDCALPGFDLVYRFSNTLSKPVTISAVLSWQAPPSLFQKAETETPTYPPGSFGVTLASKSSSNNVTIAVEPRHPESTVTTTTWQPGNDLPPWWQDLVQYGSLTASKLSSGATAAAICVKFTLQPGDQAVIPFAIAMYNSSVQNKHYYQVVAASSSEAAERLAKNWLPLHVLTRDWQYQVLFSNLPETVKSDVIQAAVPLISRTTLDHDGVFHFRHLSNASAPSICKRLLAWPMLLSFFPRHAAATLKQSNNSVAAIVEAYQYVLWTGNVDWLRPLLPKLQNLLSSFHGDDALYQLAGQCLARIQAICEGTKMPITGLTFTHSQARSEVGASVRVLAFLAAIPVNVQSSADAPNGHTAKSTPVSLAMILSGLPEAGLNELASGFTSNGWRDSAVWNAQYVVSGFQLNALNGTLAVRPTIPGTWRSMRSPIFLPSLLLTTDYRPTAHGGLLDISLERQFAFTDITGLFKSKGTAFTVNEVTIPGTPPYPAGFTPPHPQVFMRVGDEPVGFTSVVLPNGLFKLTPTPKLRLQVGDVLHITVR